MKANELMIGDLVWYNNQPHQIRQLGIFGENRDGDDYPAVCVGRPKGIGLILERNEIEPIPLTPEILEKNGIVYDYDEEECVADYKFVKLKGYQYSDDEILIDYCNGHIKVVSDFYGDVNMEIEYVHELQHALRLLKIEKEIVL